MHGVNIHWLHHLDHAACLEDGHDSTTPELGALCYSALIVSFQNI